MQKNNGKPFDLNLRKGGSDWTLLGATMTGWERLDNVRKLLTDVIQSNIPGDYIETGVWRGGSSVFARAVITAHGEQEKRVSYVCDSFSGLPPGERRLDPKDGSWDNTPYLEVPYEIVANNFMKHNVLDPISHAQAKPLFQIHIETIPSILTLTLLSRRICSPYKIQMSGLIRTPRLSPISRYRCRFYKYLDEKVCYWLSFLF